MPLECTNVLWSDLAQEANDTRRIAFLSFLLGITHSKPGQIEVAIKYYRQAVASFVATGDTAWVVASLYYLGDALTRLGQNEEALASYLEAFATVKDHLQLQKDSDREFASNLVAAIVGASVQLGKAEQALRPLNEAVEIFRQKGEGKLIAKALDWIAGIYTKLKDPEEAHANGFCGYSRTPPIEEAIKKFCNQFG